MYSSEISHVEDGRMDSYNVGLEASMYMYSSPRARISSCSASLVASGVPLSADEPLICMLANHHPSARLYHVGDAAQEASLGWAWIGHGQVGGRDGLRYVDVEIKMRRRG